MIRAARCLVCCTVLLIIAQAVEAGVVLDPGFESAGSTSFWTTFGDSNPDVASPGINPIEGTETLRLIGTGDDSAILSGAFQDIAVDGTCISVGDLVTLNGIMGHTGADPLAGLNNAFLEVAFVDASNNEFLSSTFVSSVLDSTSTTDIYQTYSTPTAIVPTNAVSVRIKSVFVHLSDSPDGKSGAAWVDNLELIVAVPEPSSGLMFATVLLPLISRRRR